MCGPDDILMSDGARIRESVREFFSREGIAVESISDPRTEFIFKVKFMRFFFTIVRPNDQHHIRIESQVLISPQHLRALTGESMKRFQIEAMKFSFTQPVLLGFVQPTPGAPGPQPPGPGFVVSQRIYDDAFSHDRLWNSIRTVHNVIDMVIHILNEVTGQFPGKSTEEDSGLAYYT